VDESRAQRALVSAEEALAEGLKIARDCGYGIYHIDLLLERARLHLFLGKPETALKDLQLALDTGIPANEKTGQPELLAATHEHCGYAWGIAEGLHLRGEALLLQAAQASGKERGERGEEGGENVEQLVGQAKECLNEALERYRDLRDPEPTEDNNFVHPETNEEYNYKAAATWQTLKDLEGDILTHYPLQPIQTETAAQSPPGPASVPLAPGATAPHSAGDPPGAASVPLAPGATAPLSAGDPPGAASVPLAPGATASRSAGETPATPGGIIESRRPMTSEPYGEHKQMEGHQLNVFVSYSHKDEEYREELDNHLSILKRQGTIATWNDRKITAGTEWENQIDENLESAEIVLLLISADFLASDYCYDIELKRAIERHDAGEARVIPVIVRSVDWKGAPFGKLQALPKDGKPVSTWDDRDVAFTQVAEGIRKAVDELNP